MTLELTAAVVAGLWGGGHCVGMCGPLLLALRLGQRPWLLLLANLGRICSYALAGALLAGSSQQLGQLAELRPDHPAWRWALGGMMILSGLQLLGLWRGLHRLEALLAPLWQRLNRYARPLLPPRTPLQALLFGVLWGWLPCGLVYGMLLWAMLQADALQGAALMMVFGLSTVPMLFAMAWLGDKAFSLLPARRLHQFSGVLLLLLGVATMVTAA